MLAIGNQEKNWQKFVKNVCFHFSMPFFHNTWNWLVLIQFLNVIEKRFRDKILTYLKYMDGKFS